MAAVPPACGHLDQVLVTELPESVDGCRSCLEIGTLWVHLRLCLTCGRVGCCDSSPERHASRHAAELEHPIVRSIEPGEDWSWCFPDEVAMRLPVHGEPRIPRSPLGG